MGRGPTKIIPEPHVGCSHELLTTVQAAQRLGLGRNTVPRWGRDGLIRNYGNRKVARWCTKELLDAPPQATELYRLRRRHNIAVCTEPGCDVVPKARGLCDRHYNAMLKQTGRRVSKPSTPRDNAEHMLRLGRLLHPPRTLPYRAVALSCPDCGLLRTTPFHLLRLDSGPMPKCPVCSVNRAVRYRRVRMKRDEVYRRKNIQRADRNKKRVNDKLRDTASRHGQQWTGPELEIATRRDLSAAQVAKMLGRTLYGVKHQRSLLAQNNPVKTWLAGVAVTTQGEP